MKLTAFRNQLKWIMRYSWVLFRKGIGSFSTALKLSWQIMRSRIKRHHTKARGTSHYQPNLKCISKLQPEQFSIQFVKEPENQFDTDAVKIVAVVFGNSVLKLGFLSKELTAKWKEQLANEDSIKVVDYEITGVKRASAFVGINLTYVITTPTATS